MRKIRTAVIGTGFMGRVHTEAIRRLGNVEIAAVAGETEELAKSFGEQMGIENVTGDYRKVLADPSIEAVHVCTPNATHFPISKEAMLAGKHVLCEKPLAVSSEEARELMEIAREKKLANCLNHNLRYYPMVQQMRRMRENGELGEILVVQGTYSQDWLLYDTDWNWRIVAKDNGPLRVMGDIGSHWMDMVQHVTGLQITALCADLQTFHKTRKRPKQAVETFAGKTLRPEDYDEVPIDTEDFGAVLLRLGDRARGAFTASQVNVGCKNRLQIEIYGTKAGVIWNQERPDELWIGQRNSSNQIIIKDPSLMAEKARSFADLPGGHSEGYDDAHKQCFRRFYATIADRSAPVEYPTFADGYQMMRVLEKVLESAQKGAWVKIDPVAAEAKA
ncbi:MAG TPA: Gfo/Idh/MocA family oxidoreductase [Bryobacteraceae bacterium]|nr:Gfo/Idh/MocA family oxidoreductase [Bryobacteraceae bacterium]HOQ44219.1 Gfo/Idh/MocA family oxidoreductase [Bryobacteraceae bacterium]HPQ13921.1 Gfo/Idh/MocA family oxidoreductase [Bryobacteraceae bacterium]HPU70537.1 Gfo/Idh/MocA family oxidoreductase [Bryobacteraceae bacterium]